MLSALERDFGSYEKFKEQFAKEGVAQFGSGWVWLVASGGKLAIEKTPNAVTPMAEGKTVPPDHRCVGTCYYLDYQNRRPTS
jgi:Fe-Mn family superoxide dismutase